MSKRCIHRIVLSNAPTYLNHCLVIHHQGMAGLAWCLCLSTSRHGLRQLSRGAPARFILCHLTPQTAIHVPILVFLNRGLLELHAFSRPEQVSPYLRRVDLCAPRELITLVTALHHRRRRHVASSRIHSYSSGGRRHHCFRSHVRNWRRRGGRGSGSHPVPPKT